MTHFPFILADDDNIGKIVGFVIIAVIWGIGALSSVLKKATKTATRPTAYRPVVGPPIAPKAQAIQPARRAAPVPQRKATPVRRPSPVPAAAVQQRPQAAPVARRQPPAAPSPIMAPVVVRHVVGTANSAAIRRWLQPDSLRKQFILTELLQPPIGLRAPRDLGTIPTE